MGAFSRQVNRLMLVIILALGSLAVAACDTAEDRLAKHVESGQELVAEGALEKATVEFRNALAIDADNVPAHLGMVEIYERQQNYPAMLGHLNKVVGVEPKNETALVKLGQIMMLGGQLDDALIQADAAVAAAPQNVAALVLKAGVSLRLGNSDTALDFAKRAIALDPANPTAHAVLIGERLNADDIDGALAIADDITARAPEDLGVALVKLQALERRGDTEQVGAYLEQLVGLFPDQTSLKTALARWYVQNDRAADAEATLRSIAEARPDDSEAALRVVRFVFSEKGEAAAREELERLIADREDKTPYRVALAQLEYGQGETEEAKTRLADIIAGLEAADDDVELNKVRLILARHLLREDDRAQALELVQSVLENAPANVDALTIRAALRFSDEDYTNALLDIRAGLAGDPSNAQLLLLSARTHQRTGGTDIASENYSAAMEASGYSPEITMEYVSFLRLNQRDDAIATVLTEAVRRQPSDKDLLTALAEAQLRAGDWTGADQTAAQLAAVDRDAAMRVRAATLSGQNRFDESLSVLEDISKDPSQRDSTLAATVQVYYKAGEIDKAMAFLADVLEENPQNVQALMLRASLHASQNDAASAEADYKAAMAANPRAQAPVLGLGRLYLALGRDEEMLSLMNAGVDAVDEPSGLRLFLGGYYESRQRPEDAIAQYRALFAAQPTSMVAANNLASLLVEYHGDDPAALAEAEEISGALRGVEIPAFQDTYGWIRYKLGDYTQAVRYLEPAAEALPGNPYVRYHLGLAYAALNAADSARPHLEAAAAADPRAFAFTAEAKAALEALPPPAE